VENDPSSDLRKVLVNKLETLTSPSLTPCKCKKIIVRPSGGSELAG
jgi:hypothetical protein